VLYELFILCRAAKNEPRKRAKAFPLGSPGIAALQREPRDKHKKLLCVASNTANTRGRRRKQTVLRGAKGY
jgi:hypothetical protein